MKPDLSYLKHAILFSLPETNILYLGDMDSVSHNRQASFSSRLFEYSNGCCWLRKETYASIIPRCASFCTNQGINNKTSSVITRDRKPTKKVAHSL